VASSATLRARINVRLKKGDHFTCTVMVVGTLEPPNVSTTTQLPPDLTVPTTPNVTVPGEVDFVATVTQVDNKGTVSIETRRS